MSETKIKYPRIKDELGQIQSAGFLQFVRVKFIHLCYEFNKHKVYSTFFSAFLMIVGYFQLYSQLLDASFLPNVSEEWGPFGFMTIILKIARLSPYIGDSASSSSTLLLVYFLISLIVLYYLGFYYMHFSLTIQKLYFTLPLKLACIFGEILIWVLIIPVCEIFIDIFRCNPQDMSLSLNDVKCNSVAHIIHMVFVGIGLIMYIFAGIVISFYFNDSQPCTNHTGEYGFSRLDINTEIYFCVFRVIIGVARRWLAEGELYWVILIFHLIYALPKAYVYYYYVPYYKRSISTLYCGCVMSHIWVIFNIVMYKIMGGDAIGSDTRSYKGAAMVTILGMMVLFGGALKVRDKLIRRKMMQFQHLRISTNEELDIYVQGLLNMYISQQTDPSDELLLKGIITKHKAESTDTECPLKKLEGERFYHPGTNTESDTDKTNSKDKIVLLAMINGMLKERERSKKFGSEISACFHLVFANFLFKEMGNIHMAIVEIMKAQRSSPSVQQEVSIYHLQRSVEAYLISKYKNNNTKNLKDNDNDEDHSKKICENLDMMIVIKFESLLVQLKIMIERCTAEHIEFWSHLESLLPDLNELNRIGLNILKSSNEIAAIWKKIIKINPRNINILTIYEHFLRDIKDEVEKAEECLRCINDIRAHKADAEDANNEFSILFSESATVIVINGSPENLGKIIKTNPGVLKLFGYNSYEIYGTDISILMPSLFAQKHQELMHRYFETGRQRMIKKENVLFGLHRNNFLFCVAIVIKPIYSLLTAVPQYIGLLREVQKEFDFIITDMDGKIDSISAGIGNTFNISANLVKENKIYVHLICPELADPVEYDKQTLRLKFDCIQGRHRLTFWVPRDFTTLAHLFSQTARNPLEPSSINNRQTDDDELFPKDFKRVPDFFKQTYKIFKEKKKGKEFNFAKNNIIQECFSYNTVSVKKTIRCEVTTMTFANEILKVKVFKLYKEKAMKRKSSLKGYIPGEDSESHHKITPKNLRRVTPLEHKKSTPEAFKRSCTGELGDSKNDMPKTAGNNDGEHSRVTELIPSINKAVNLTDTFSIQNILYDTSRDGATKLSDEKKSRQDLSRSSGTRHFNSKLRSATDSVPEIKPLSGSATSEFVSYAEDEKRMQNGLIIKTIEPRQAEIGKQLLIRRKTIMDTKDSTKEDKKGDENQETTEELKKQESFKVDQISLKKEESEFNPDESSVSTTNNSVLHKIASLRDTLNVEYTPPAISQLKFAAFGICLVFLTLSIVSFIFSLKVYSSLDKSMDYIIEAKDRKASIGNVAGFTRLLYLLTCTVDNPCIKEKDFEEINYLFKGKSLPYKQWVRENLGEYASILKESQVILSNSKNTIGLKDVKAVNPSNIIVSFNSIANRSFSTVIMDATEAIDGLVMHALRVKGNNENYADQDWIKVSENSLFFILTNALNSILSKVERSSDALSDNTRNIAGKHRTALLVFLIFINGVLIPVGAIIMFLVIKIRKNKQDLLAMFIEIPIKKAKAQLEKCQGYCKMLHEEGDVEGQAMSENGKDDKKEEEEDLLLTDNKNPLAEDMTKKRKKYKPYSSGIVSLIIESVVVVAILEFFFIYLFARSVWLRNSMSHLVDEVGIIINRRTSNELYYWIELELIATNGEGNVMHNRVDGYIFTYYEKILKDQEHFLRIHSDNNPYNSKDYKILFDTIIYGDVCEIIFKDYKVIEECHNYMNGVLKKGLNSANVAFWGDLKELAEDFLSEKSRDVDAQNDALKDERLVNNHWLLYRYFTRSYSTIQKGLRDSIRVLFRFEKGLLTGLFCVYLLMVVVIFIGFVKVFVENTKDSLWVTKSLLGVIPTEIILQVNKIKHFLMVTSKSTMYGIGNN